MLAIVSGEQFESLLTAPMRSLAANADTMQTSRVRNASRLSGLLLLILACVCVVDAQDQVETIRIDANLVDLKVSVLASAMGTNVPLLTQTDFVVLEDGAPQEITFFAAADAPFDLVLLLDLSGSNSKKLKMIRNSAKRFIDAARSIDRIALVTFTDQVALYSSFTHDRRLLKKSIDDMDEAVGGTKFWDALDYVLREMTVQGDGLRRSAVVVMSDGVDNALPDVPGPGSRISFEKLLDEVRGSESIVF